jgi:predicted MFS family arabinose efflux permease
MLPRLFGELALINIVRIDNQNFSLFSGATYFTFLIAEGKPALMLAQGIIAGGTGALYTVQVGICSMSLSHLSLQVLVQSSTIRLIADERIGASMFGVVIGALNLAAFLGTFMGGPLSDHLSMEHCYIIGGIMGMVRAYQQESIS